MTNIEYEIARFNRDLNGTCEYWRKHAEEELEKRRQEIADHKVLIKDGTFRWAVNGQYVPTEIAVQFSMVSDLIDLEAQERARSQQLDEFAASYRRAMKNHVYNDEEMFEMRAAFGEGSTVVDVLSGRKIRL